MHFRLAFLCDARQLIMYTVKPWQGFCPCGSHRLRAALGARPSISKAGKTHPPHGFAQSAARTEPSRTHEVLADPPFTVGAVLGRQAGAGRYMISRRIDRPAISLALSHKS